MRPPNLPPELTCLRVFAAQARRRAQDRGSITLEWMVIIGILFAAAVWAATKIVAAIHNHANQVQ